MLGAGFVIVGLVVGLASGHSVAQLLVFDRELEPAAVALEYRLIAFDFTFGQSPGASIEWVAPKCYTELRFWRGGRHQAESMIQ